MKMEETGRKRAPNRPTVCMHILETPASFYARNPHAHKCMYDVATEINFFSVGCPQWV